MNQFGEEEACNISIFFGKFRRNLMTFYVNFWYYQEYEVDCWIISAVTDFSELLDDMKVKYTPLT